MANLKNYKYKIIKNFFLKEELIFLKAYCFNALKQNTFNNKITNNNSPCTPSWYGDITMNTFASLKKPLIEKNTNLSLKETYTFWRTYIYGSTLKDHKDREACEISVTANIDHSEVWPIHMDNKWLSLQPGDAVVYLGMEVLHGRKTFKGEYNYQVFMHYVDKNGLYKNYNENEYK